VGGDLLVGPAAELDFKDRAARPRRIHQRAKLDVHQAHQRHSCKTAPIARQSHQIVSGASQNRAVGRGCTKKEIRLSRIVSATKTTVALDLPTPFQAEKCLQRRVGPEHASEGSLNATRGEL
jgi:hypothetical protein